MPRMMTASDSPTTLPNHENVINEQFSPQRESSSFSRVWQSPFDPDNNIWQNFIKECVNSYRSDCPTPKSCHSGLRSECQYYALNYFPSFYSRQHKDCTQLSFKAKFIVLQYLFQSRGASLETTIAWAREIERN